MITRTTKPEIAKSRLAVVNRSQHSTNGRSNMNTSITQSRRFRPKVGKIAMAIAVASAVAGFTMTPAYAEEHGSRDHHERHRAPHYAHPFYAPAPVYYAPQPSPGVSLFIPIVIR
jgi:hypothetical protein